MTGISEYEIKSPIHEKFIANYECRHTNGMLEIGLVLNNSTSRSFAGTWIAPFVLTQYHCGMIELGFTFFLLQYFEHQTSRHV